MGVLLDRKGTVEDEKKSRQFYGGMERKGKGLLKEATLNGVLRNEKDFTGYTNGRTFRAGAAL